VCYRMDLESDKFGQVHCVITGISPPPVILHEHKYSSPEIVRFSEGF
jgi:hypothetical protein